jgi:hypothetical protein
MGFPEMAALWNEFTHKSKEGDLSRDESLLFKKWKKALEYLSNDPRHPGLHTHEITPLSRRYGLKVWQSYLENKKSGAARMYWVYGPGKNEITVIGLEPHPEDKKTGGYKKIQLSATGKEDPGAYV